MFVKVMFNSGIGRVLKIHDHEVNSVVDHITKAIHDKQRIVDFRKYGLSTYIGNLNQVKLIEVKESSTKKPLSKIGRAHV